MTTEWDKQAAKQALQSKLHEAQIAKVQVMEQRTRCG